MKGLYYHPERITDGDSSLMMDSGRHSSVTLFLELIEELAPEVIHDLESVYDIYAEAENWFLTYQRGSRLWPSEWRIVKQANIDQYSGYIRLKEAIDAWAHKFSLRGKDDFYQDVALTSISFYYNDCKETERKKRLREYKQLAKQFNVSLDVIRNSKKYAKLWPYEEKLVLSDNVFFEDESDDIELSKSIGKGEDIYKLFFEQVFPFIFTPDSLLNFTKEKDIHMYECMDTYYELLLRGHDRKKEEATRRGKPYSITPYSGLAWDPRIETWKEFEEQIDTAYAEYKELYRKRAENFLLKRGYVKEREKRNLEHFKWLVHYQVQGWTLREIADHYSNNSEEILHEDTVFRGIKSTAELVLIDLKQRKTTSV